jgi:hypothetical protein
MEAMARPAAHGGDDTVDPAGQGGFLREHGRKMGQRSERYDVEGAALQGLPKATWASRRPPSSRHFCAAAPQPLNTGRVADTDGPSGSLRQRTNTVAIGSDHQPQRATAVRSEIRHQATFPAIPQGSVRPQKTWRAQRERQYVHTKERLLERGKPEPLAEEIAARVVNKERAQHGESVEASASSLHDVSAGRRGGLRSRQGPGGRTLLRLRNEARQRGVKGRSTMNKAQLEAALSR